MATRTRHRHYLTCEETTVTQNPPTNLDLDEIATRAARLYEYVAVTVAEAEADFDRLTGTDVSALLAEVRRQRDEILENEAEIAKLRDLLRKENKRANAAIDREEAAEQAALEAQEELAAAPASAVAASGGEQ